MSQHQFPGFDGILLLYKMSSLGEARWSIQGALCTIFANPCESKICHLKVKKKLRRKLMAKWMETVQYPSIVDWQNKL